jgi:predicted  nucleic acid-binding Zn-ribbon protein
MVIDSTMTRISDLWRLQETDTALDSRRASSSDAESRLGESEELGAARARRDELRSTLHRAQGSQKDVELEADDLRGKIADAEKKLYSGTIKNPKELASLQADIDQLKRHLSAVEDRDLEALSALEAAQNDERTAAAELEALEAAWNEEQHDLTERVARLASEIREYEAERAERIENIAPDLLRTYDHIRLAHQGRALAKLDRSICLGCRISLPTQMVNKARAGNALVQCPNCERILYA